MNETMNKVCPGLPFTASYSGGKDSALAVYRAVKAGMELKSLLVTYNAGMGRSWFHGIPEDVLEKLSESLGVPVHLIRTDSANYSADFEKALSQEREKGAEACVFGDIDIQGHLDWGTERCLGAGLVPCFPLWNEDRRALAEESLRSGFRPTVTVVDSERLDTSFAGRPLTHETLELMAKAGIDPCGENGEYHTFVADGPIFSKPLHVIFDEPVMSGSYTVCPVRLKKGPCLEAGRVQIYTGGGKGKTTAALGLMLRASGAGLKSYFGQFMKRDEVSEVLALKSFLGDFVNLEQYGSGGEIFNPDPVRDRLCAREGYEKARRALGSGRYDLVVLDEICVAASLGFISDGDILRLVDERPSCTELVLTGRGASELLKSRADLVTEMCEIRHYYSSGLPARTGIEK
ncbi:MAG: diphthine--ammonia ligase [Candidatus Limivicinus sp.]|jgi:diphthine-ammonia ligase